MGRAVLGTMTFGAQVDESEAAAMVGMSREAGVTMFDTANNYSGGASEEILGKIIKPFRDEVVVCTKGGNVVNQEGTVLVGLARDAVRAAVDGSLRRLGLDYIDVYYLHRPDRSTPVEETLEALGDVVKAGKVRYVAQSNFAAWEIAEMVKVADHNGWPSPRISQPQYNLLSRRVEDEYASCSEHLGLTDVVYNPLAGGMLTGKHRMDEKLQSGTRFTKATYQQRYWNTSQFEAVEALRAVAQQAGLRLIELALRWLLGRPLVDCVLLGASTPGQLRENLRALEGPPLDDATLEACDDVWRGLRGPASDYHR